MNTTVVCPTCGAELELRDFSVGEVIKCPGCSQSFISELPKNNENEEQIIAPIGILKRKPLSNPKDIVAKETVIQTGPEVVRLLKKLVKYARLWTTIFIFIPIVSTLITVPLVMLLKESKLIYIGYLIAGISTIGAVVNSFFDNE